MFPEALKLLCLWLCSEVVASHLHWNKTKAILNAQYESIATNKKGHRQRWPTISWDDDRGERPGSVLASWLGNVNLKSSEFWTAGMPREFVSKSYARNIATLTRPVSGSVLHAEEYKANEQRIGGYYPRVYKPAPHGASCKHRRSERKQRHTWGPKAGTPKLSKPPLYAGESLPAVMAQGQANGPPNILNTSEYGNDYTFPDVSDTTPFVPENTRTRRKMINLFYPVTSESYKAYAVMILAAVMFTVGIIGNLSVMCIVSHNYYMRSISNSLLANLALWDFIIIFFCLPLVVFHEVTKNWLLGEFSCKIIPYLEVRGIH